MRMSHCLSMADFAAATAMRSAAKARAVFRYIFLGNWSIRMMYASDPDGYVSHSENRPSQAPLYVSSNRARIFASKASDPLYHPSGPTSSSQKLRISSGLAITPLSTHASHVPILSCLYCLNLFTIYVSATHWIESLRQFRPLFQFRWRILVHIPAPQRCNSGQPEHTYRYPLRRSSARALICRTHRRPKR